MYKGGLLWIYWSKNSKISHWIPAWAENWPFSHLTSPSVIDSGNRGVVTIWTSLPGQNDKWFITFYQYYYKLGEQKQIYSLFQVLYWTQEANSIITYI